MATIQVQNFRNPTPSLIYYDSMTIRREFEPKHSSNRGIGSEVCNFY